MKTKNILFSLRTLSALVVALGLTACGGGGDPDAQKSAAAASAQPSLSADLSTQVQTEVPDTVPRDLLKRAGGDGAAITASADLLAKSMAALPADKNYIGAPVALAETATTASTMALLAWKPAGNGTSIARLTFLSPGAKGIRVGLNIESLPFGTTVRAYAPTATMQYQIPGQEILQRFAADGATATTNTWWTPDQDTDTQVVEIEVPTGMEGQVRFSASKLSHRFADPAKDKTLLKVAPRSTGQTDAICDADYQAQMKAAVFIWTTTNDGAVWGGSGVLVANKFQDSAPYVLTAGHIIANANEAANASFRFFYWNMQCGSDSLNPSAVVVNGGAALLSRDDYADYAFLRMNRFAPPGVNFSTVSSQANVSGSSVTVIGFPAADPAKISKGVIDDLQKCVSATDVRSERICAPNQSDGNDFQIRWAQGSTEEGFSGGAVYKKTNDALEVIGLISVGFKNGPVTQATRTSIFYQNIAQWLNPSAPAIRQPIYRFYNRASGGHFFTQSVAERDNVIKTLPTFSYEGPAFYAYAGKVDDTSAVYRFYRNATGAHFYTQNTGERDALRSQPAKAPEYIWDDGAKKWVWTVYPPDFNYEGPVWYAAQTPVAGSQPLYRFFNTQTGIHFYTISLAERDNVIANLKQFRYEGTAYYAWSGH